MFALMLISVESFIQSSYGDGHECNCNANVLVSNVKSLMICSCTYSVIVNTHRLGGEGGGGGVRDHICNFNAQDHKNRCSSKRVITGL